MPWQNFDPKTGTQTTYKGETADTGIAKVEQINSNFQPAPAPVAAPALATPTPKTTAPSTPAVATKPVASTTATPTSVTPGKNQGIENLVNSGRVFNETDAKNYAYSKGETNWQQYVGGTGGQKKTTATPTSGVPGKNQGIDALVASGKVMNETDAKNFAHSKGETNWQQYVNGTAGAANPLYIGSANWLSLKGTYTPYQLQQATTLTKDGIYWNDKVNIGEIPRIDPATQINNDAKKLADIISSAKKDSTSLTTDKGVGDTADKTQENLADMYNSAPTAEATYKELYNSPEIKATQAELATYTKKNDEYDQQLDELKDDVRKEVEGEAPESYISALAAVRGDKILKMKRANQRDLDAATATLNGLKENANFLLQARTKDTDSRYDKLFQMMQYQAQQGQIDFNNQMTMMNFAQGLSEGRSMTMQDGTVIKGLKENDNINAMSFTTADGKMWVKGIDKNTGELKYNTFMGQGKVASSGGTTAQETAPMDVATANYWLGLVKQTDENGKASYDIGKIPEKVRQGVVDVMSKQPQAPAAQPDTKNWWQRQGSDLLKAINPFD